MVAMTLERSIGYLGKNYLLRNASEAWVPETILHSISTCMPNRGGGCSKITPPWLQEFSRLGTTLIALLWKAQVRRNASYYSWSLCKARCVIKKGSKWQVRMGKDVRTWGDRWIPYPSRFQIFFPKPLRCDLRSDDQLITDHQWNVPLTCIFFRM